MMNRKHFLRDHPIIRCPKNTHWQGSTSLRKVILTNLLHCIFIEMRLRCYCRRVVPKNSFKHNRIYVLNYMTQMLQVSKNSNIKKKLKQVNIHDKYKWPATRKMQVYYVAAHHTIKTKKKNIQTMATFT